MSNWRQQLDAAFQQAEAHKQQQQTTAAQEQSEAEEFFRTVALPAFEELKPELEKHGREVSVGAGRDSASIRVTYQGRLELQYVLKAHGRRPFPETRRIDHSTGQQYKAEGYLRSDNNYTFADITADEIIRHFLADYTDHLKHGS